MKRCGVPVIGFGVLLFLASILAGPAQDQAPAQPPPGPKRGATMQTPQDRARIEERLNNAWSAMPLEEKARVMHLHRGLRSLPADERKQINQRIEHYLSMSPQERKQVQQNNQSWLEMTPAQRARAKEEFLKHRNELEEKWRKEHPGEEPPPPGN